MDRKCWICGKAATKGGTKISLKYHYTREEQESLAHRAYCSVCYEEENRKLSEAKNEYIRIKNFLMFERAIKLFEKQNIIIDEYKEAITTVKDFISRNPHKFESSHEILAAIILIDNEIQTKTQYEVGKYRVDFFLPELKIVLEIDGDRHAHRLYDDNSRDIAIRDTLGKDWEVVRVKTEYIEQNAEMLVEAIKAIKREKQKLRAENYGFLPEWYSERTKSKKPKQKTVYGDELLIDN